MQTKGLPLITAALVHCLILFSCPARAQAGSDNNPPDIGKCIAFLEQHPNSPEADAVSDAVCRYVLDCLGPGSTEKEYDEAIRYARSAQMKAEATARKKEWEESARRRKHYIDKREFWNLGIGAYAAAWNNNDIGLFLTVKAGGDSTPLNYFLSMGFSYWNTWLPRDVDAYYQWANFNLSVGGRLNTLWRGTFISSSVGFQAPINKAIDYTLKYYYNLQAPSRFHPVFALNAGQKVNHLEWSIGAVADMTPAYRQQMIYESSYYDYDATRDLLDSRWRLSFTVTYYFWQ